MRKIIVLGRNCPACNELILATVLHNSQSDLENHVIMVDKDTNDQRANCVVAALGVNSIEEIKTPSGIIGNTYINWSFDANHFYNFLQTLIGKG